jgi:hypothetical protein
MMTRFVPPTGVDLLQVCSERQLSLYTFMLRSVQCYGLCHPRLAVLRSVPPTVRVLRSVPPTVSTLPLLGQIFDGHFYLFENQPFKSRSRPP